jgi:programmed cell death 6-interacting protein
VGGYVALEYSRDSVARLRSECIEMLSHCVSALNEEEQQDCIARQQYGAKWTRPLSSQLTVLLRKRLDELQSALNGSERNDAALAELFNVHIPMIISLCSPAHELAATIPNTGTSSDGLLSSSLLGEVTGAVVQREVFQERRNELIGKLDSAVNSVDLVDRLYALEGQPHDEIKKVLNDEFKAAIDPISSLFEQFKADVAEYEWRLEQLMLSFQTAQQHKQSSSQERQNILQSLDEAYNAFKTISAQLQAATTFYTSFLDQLHPLKNVCLDFASTRRNEYQSMMGTLASAPPAYGVSHPPPPPHHHHYQQQQQQQQQQQTDPQRPNPYPSQHPSQYTQHPPPPPGPYPPQYPLQSHPNPHGGPPNHPPRGYQPQPGAWNPSMPVQYAPPANVSPASYGHYTGHPQAFSQPAAPMPYPYDGAPGASNASSIQQSSPNTHSLPHMPPTSPTLYPRQPPRPH